MKPDGTLEAWFVNGWNTLVGRSGGEAFNGVYGFITGQAQANANLQAQIDAASAAATASIAAGGSTVDDFDQFSGASIGSAVPAAYATCDITTTGAGNFTVTVTFNVDGVTTDIIADGGICDGIWSIVENGAADHVLATGTFRVLSILQVDAGGSPFYNNTLSILTGTLPETPTAYASNEVAAETVELRLSVTSGNSVSNVNGSLLVSWA